MIYIWLYVWDYSHNSMDNLLSNCGLVDVRISTSEKDLPVERGKHSDLGT